MCCFTWTICDPRRQVHHLVDGVWEADMQCPVCRAENSERTCRRCRADLSMMADLEADRAALLREAAKAFARHDGAAVSAAASAAHHLRRGTDSASWAAIGFLLRRDFASAHAWHARIVDNRS